MTNINVRVSNKAETSSKECECFERGELVEHEGFCVLNFSHSIQQLSLNRPENINLYRYDVKFKLA